MKGKLFSLLILAGISVAVVTGLLNAFNALSVADVAGTAPFRGAAEISPEGRSNPHILLFTLYGAEHTSYLREMATTVYDPQRRKWRLESDRQDDEYRGEFVGRTVPDGVRETKIDVINVSLESTFGYSRVASLPTSLHTLQVSYPRPLSYFPEDELFFAGDLPLLNYSFTTVHYRFDEAALANASAGTGGVYLELPRGMDSRIRELAREITAGLKRPYQKAMAIESYLESIYIYDPEYTRCPWGEEPHAWFLFDERRGVCANFNSAFVVLCRSAGIPARLVSGYMISPNPWTQQVYADQAHVWAEVSLQGLGWVTFDATGSRSESGGKTVQTIATSTKIEQLTGAGDSFRKGDGFTATGTVKGHFVEVNSSGTENEPETGTTDTVAKPLAGVTVEVYVSDSKIAGEYVGGRNEWRFRSIMAGSRMAGIGETNADGVFEIACTIPVEISAGEYHVLARAVPTEEYDESWSDPEIEVTSETSILIISPREFELDKPAEVFGVLREEPDYVESVAKEGPTGGVDRRPAWNPVPDAEVDIYIDGSLVAEAM